MDIRSPGGVRLVRALLSHLGTPRALTAWLLFKHKEWDQLVQLGLDPLQYSADPLDLIQLGLPLRAAERYRRDKQATDLLRKIPFPTSSARESVARASWEEAENQCLQTNTLLECLKFGTLGPDEAKLLRFLDAVKKLVTRVLGPLPDRLHGRFGPGTVFEYRDRKSPTILDKIWGKAPHVTPAASTLFRLDYDRTWWSRRRCEEGLHYLSTTRGNRYTTVPKDGRTDRSISVEPSGNLWVQLGIGAHLKGRLEVFGLRGFRPKNRFPWYPTLPLDDDPQPRHKHLAMVGSVTGEWCTIDLSSASDTVAKKFVEAVTPADWFSLLNDSRSPTTTVGGKIRYLEKFSSMGNGFTFELETILFAAISSVAGDLRIGEDLFVFGDDIIVPKHAFKNVSAALRLCGFSLNQKKSFDKGYFRESCGGDFFGGLSVTPVRLTDLELELPQCFAFFNAFRGWGFPESALSELISCVPLRFRKFGPKELGDRVFHRMGDESHADFEVHHQACNTWVRCVTFEVNGDDEIPVERWGLASDWVMHYLLCGQTVCRRSSRVVPRLSWGCLPYRLGVTGKSHADPPRGAVRGVRPALVGSPV